MFDTSRALADMANQIRACRVADGLTLQQLATRSGVAASTIHKVEARQMVPTVSVLLKIAKGLARRPEELIRDDPNRESSENEPQTASADRTDESPSMLGANGTEARDAAPSITHGQANGHTKRDVGVWNIDVSTGHAMPTRDLDPRQRAIVLVQRGALDLCAGSERLRMDAGDCVEVEGQRIASNSEAGDTASLMLIVSPPGDLCARLGQPNGGLAALG